MWFPRRLLQLLLLLLLYPAVVVVVRSAAAVDLGTTLVAVKYRDGVVVAADTRTSTGGNLVYHRYARKVCPVGDGTVICRSGGSADTQRLVDLVIQVHASKMHRSGTPMQASEIAHYLRSCMVTVRRDREQEYVASLIVAGIERDSDAQQQQLVPRIFSVALSGALIEERLFAVSGSGSTIILGYLDHHFRERNGDGALLTKDDAVALCHTALQLACQRDAAS
jgi:20S proteasome subunit beta 1